MPKLLREGRVGQFPRNPTRVSTPANKPANKAVALVAVGALLAAVSFRVVSRVEVTGTSMVPTLEPGDRLVVIRKARLRPGDIAVIADPRDPSRELIKRVADNEAGWMVVIGDNSPSSTDSREFGRIPPGAVRGSAIYRYAPASRAGWVAPPGRRWAPIRGIFAAR